MNSKWSVQEAINNILNSTLGYFKFVVGQNQTKKPLKAIEGWKALYNIETEFY